MINTQHPSRLRCRHAIALCCLTLLLVACSTTGNAPTSTSGILNGKGCLRVGILLPDTSTSDRWEAKDHPLLVQAVKQAIPGVQIDYNNAQGSSDTQLSQAETDLANNDCILIVAPHDSVAAASIVQKALPYHVPVIAYDRLIQSKDTSYYVSFDGVAVGKLQGEYIARHYQAYTLPLEHANVALINGSQTDTNALLFGEGVHQILDPLLVQGTLKNIYETFTPDWNDATAQTEMEVALANLQNNIQIAYIANDGMADSAITALRIAHLNGRVLVTGQDATVTGIHNILAGDQNMTVYKPIIKEAQSVGAVVKALYAGLSTSSLTNGQTVPTVDGGSIMAILDAPIEVDSSNIASTVLADHYVLQSQICVGIRAGTDGVC
ncbi:MAG TPA: substrate-binding domain-containing protein [Ktedonobacteraceae bacterium]